MLIKVNNLIQKDGYADYKGLDTKKIVGGSQLYPLNENAAYFEYQGEVNIGGDVETVTPEAYETVKLQIEEETPVSPEEELAQLKQQVIAQQSAINMILGV
ncbi:hypothetical protein KDN24_12825 [Bacillus sp. Bva_UNVM-123]|uniref:hypothetical protein n=1 Tax=Bacillus sp. Bva_UNVM-123 TaxID=2829798 RepID=UPI00391F54CA